MEEKQHSRLDEQGGQRYGTTKELGVSRVANGSFMLEVIEKTKKVL